MSDGTPAGPSYEELVAELEELTQRMSSADIGIEEAADLYERAGGLHNQARARLDQVRARIEALTAEPPQA
jgi:exodeoxyribonuclease VII small subunit